MTRRAYISRYTRLYFKYFSIHIKGQMQYKKSFFLTLAAQFMISFTEFLGIYFMFDRFNAVEGFTFEQALLCYATVLTAFAFAMVFARGFDTFPRMLGNGEFDRALVRPRGLIFQVVALKMDFARLGRFLQALFMFCYAIPRSGVVWTFDKILTLFLMVVCGSLVFAGLFVVYAAFAFFTVEGLEFMNILTDGGCTFGRYPFSVYGDTVLRFLTFAVPLALFQYYPLLYLLDIESGAMYMFAPLLSLLFLLPCFIFYRFGLKNYKSTGS